MTPQPTAGEIAAGVTVEDVGRRCTVTLHRGLGTLAGTIAAVGRLDAKLNPEPIALVDLDDGDLIETSLSTITLEAPTA